MIKNLNATARITVDTPVGTSKEFSIEDIVKQGTVYAVDICAATMDHINKTGYGIKTMYGPDLEINALAFVDDVASGGNVLTANNTVESCSVLEKKKKITMNTDAGKSAIMTVNGKKNNNSVTKKVKEGEFGEVDEYKHLGVWLDTSGSYSINIRKNMPKIVYMTNNIKALANGHNMGSLATAARLKMVETTVIPAVLFGVEAFPSITKTEQQQLEMMQGKLLKDLMELPHSTPYEALLLEMGLPTMNARINYRKLMLYHNIRNSDEKRIVKKLVEEQKKMDREGTWWNGVEKIMEKYGLDDTTDEDLKSTWKTKIKSRIAEVTGKELRTLCGDKSKARTVTKGKYEIKSYLKESTVSQATRILKARLHMLNLPCNFRKEVADDTCPLCGVDKIRTEHYYHCQQTEKLRNIWKTGEDDLLSDDVATLARTTNFLEAVALRIQPKWKDTEQFRLHRSTEGYLHSY